MAKSNLRLPPLARTSRKLEVSRFGPVIGRKCRTKFKQRFGADQSSFDIPKSRTCEKTAVGLNRLSLSRPARHPSAVAGLDRHL